MGPWFHGTTTYEQHWYDGQKPAHGAPNNEVKRMDVIDADNGQCDH